MGEPAIVTNEGEKIREALFLTLIIPFQNISKL